MENSAERRFVSANPSNSDFESCFFGLLRKSTCPAISEIYNLWTD